MVKLKKHKQRKRNKFRYVFIGMLGIFSVIIILSLLLIKKDQDNKDSVIKITYLINGKEASKSEFEKVKGGLQIAEIGTEGEREDGFITYYQATNKKGNEYEYIESYWENKKIFEINEKQENNSN